MSGPFGSSSFNHLISSGFYNGAISRSLRLDDGSNPELNLTPPTSGDRQKFTMSVWIKRSNLSTAMRIFGGETNNGLGNQFTFFGIDSDDRFRFDRLQDGTTNTVIAAGSRLRDVSAWYNLVGAVDTTQSTEANRVRLYINGVEETLTESSSGFPSLNLNTMINTPGSEAQPTRHIIAHTGYNNSLNFDGYMSDFNFVDGQQLLPTSFGEFKEGIWIPIDTSGLTFGGNGFRLEFKQTGTGGATASTIGADTSGNTSHFTDAGLSSTDSNLPDCCENNFAVLNPLQQRSNSSATFSEGNLKATGSSASTSGIMTGTFGVSSGKWYWEVLAGGTPYLNTGVIRESGSNYFDVDATADAGFKSNEYVYINNGNKYNNNSSASYGATYTNGDIIGVALDLDNDTLTFYKNNSTQDVAYSSLPAGTYIPVFDCYNGSNWTFNAGQDSSFAGAKTAQGNTDGNGIGDFYYSPPSGHSALCSSNLPDPELSPNKGEQATDYFNTILYTGNGADNRTLTGVGFQPDWTWIKNRSNAGNNHILTDSSRGAGKEINSDLDAAEDTTNTNKLEAFTSDGFTLGASPHSSVNSNTHTYVAWNWHVNGGTTSSNGDGSITSTVQVSQKAGISIVQWNGEGDGEATVGHGLGAVPKVIMPKNRDATGNWHMYHVGLHPQQADSHDYGILLNSPNARTNDAGFHNDTAPTSSVFTVGTYNNFNNNYVAYVFTDIDGYSKFGVYEGNSNANGTFVYTGFRPAMVMFKHFDGSDEWVIGDNKRDPSNTVVGQLFPSTDGAESRSNNICDFLSNGFKLRRNAGSINQATQIYMAWAEAPFKFANAR